MSNRDAERLLPKPGGFEGFGWLVKEGLEAKQLAVSDLKEDPHWLIERDAAPPAVEADMAQCGDEISRVAPLLDCHFPLVELLVDLPQVATDARSAAHGLPQDPTHEHDVGVDLLVREHALAGVPPFEHVPGEFDVLLRHHPHLSREASTRSSAALERLLQPRLIFRKLLGGIATRQRGDQLADEAVASQVELLGDPRVRSIAHRLDRDAADRPDRTVQPPEGDLSRRIVFGDLKGERARSAGHPSHLDDARSHARWPLRLLLDTDEVLLPLGMPFDLVEVGEYLLWPSSDLDAFDDHAGLPLSSGLSYEPRSGASACPSTGPKGKVARGRKLHHSKRHVDRRRRPFPSAHVPCPIGQLLEPRAKHQLSSIPRRTNGRRTREARGRNPSALGTVDTDRYGALS